MNIKFTVFGNPVAKGRPRFCVRGGFARAYTPAKTRDAESDFRSQSLPYKPKELITGAIKLSISVYRQIPASFSKKKVLLAEAGEILPISRPDADNYLKLCADSLNGIFWRDDSQIVDCLVIKRYSSKPRIEVILEEITNGT